MPVALSATGIMLAIVVFSRKKQNEKSNLCSLLLWKNSPNGVAEAMTDHINLGYGVMEKALGTFDYDGSK